MKSTSAYLAVLPSSQAFPPPSRRRPSSPTSAFIGLVLVAIIFSVALYVFHALVHSLPNLLDKEKGHFTKLPKTLDEIRTLSRIIKTYIKTNWTPFVILYSYVYIFLQSFAIPGSISLSIVGGAVFGLRNGLGLVCICSAIGATNAYLLSWLAAGPLLRGGFKNRIEKMKLQVAQNRNQLFPYMLFLRITPLCPNWLLNLAAPHLGIPIHVFFITTVIGVAPLSLLHIQAGETLDEMSSLEEVSLLNSKNLGRMALVVVGSAVLLVIPKLWKPKDVDESSLTTKTE